MRLLWKQVRIWGVHLCLWRLVHRGWGKHTGIGRSRSHRHASHGLKEGFDGGKFLGMRGFLIGHAGSQLCNGFIVRFLEVVDDSLEFSILLFQLNFSS